MNKTLTKTETDVIDVAGEFDYSTQSDSYNACFSEWRKNRKNPYAYNFTLHKKESVYIEGKGFVSDSPAEAEAKTMSRLLSLIGITMLIIVIIENVFSKLFVAVLDIIGINVHNTFFNSVIYGGCREVAMVLVVITALKLLIPMIIVHIKLKMPLKCSVPLTTKNSLELIAAIAAAFIASAVLGIPYVFAEGNTEVYEFFRSYNADISVWGQNEFLVYSFFDVIIVPILFEILFRGAMFTALRQFGDIYAVIISSVVSGLVMQSFTAALGTLVISVIASIGMLRSGSILTPIAVRVIYKMYIFTVSVLRMNEENVMLLEQGIFMAAVFVVGIVVLTLLLTKGGLKNTRFFADYTCHISRKGHALVTLKEFIFVAPAVLCLLIALLSAVLHT